MDNKKRSVLVSLWQELPQITVRLKEKNTIYHFTVSFVESYCFWEEASSNDV